MARIAGVWDAELFRQLWPDESECVAADELTFDGDFDVRHVACRALAASAFFGMMRMFRNRGAQACGIVLSVTAKAKLISGCNQVGRVSVAVNVMAIETAEAAMVHVAVHEIVALHPVLVRSAVRPVIKVLNTKL
jgi:hypothetical protein